MSRGEGEAFIQKWTDNKVTLWIEKSEEQMGAAVGGGGRTRPPHPTGTMTSNCAEQRAQALRTILRISVINLLLCSMGSHGRTSKMVILMRDSSL